MISALELHRINIARARAGKPPLSIERANLALLDAAIRDEDRTNYLVDLVIA